MAKREVAARWKGFAAEGQAEKRQKQTSLSHHLLRATLLIGVMGLANEMFPQLILFLAACDVAVTQTAGMSNHSRYFWGCLWTISESLLRAQVAHIKASPFFSVLMDSSSDTGKQDHVLIYVQYLQYLPQGGFKVMIQYLCTVQVATKCANLMHDVLITVMDTLEIDMSKLFGFCSDGGSEFSGKHTGVAAVLKGTGENKTALITMHCSAHRAALVMDDQAMSKLEFDGITLAVVDTLLRRVCALFKPTRRQAQWQKFLDDAKELAAHLRRKFPRYNDSRWFSRRSCLNVLTDNLPYLMVYLLAATDVKLKKDEWQIAVQVLGELYNPNLIALLMCLNDIVTTMDVFNKELQSNSLLVHDVSKHVTALQEKLRQMVKDGVYDKKLLPSFHRFHTSLMFDDMFCIWAFSTDTTRELRWQTTDGIPAADSYDNAGVMEFVYALCQALLDSLDVRFPDIKLLRAFRVLDPRTFKGTEIDLRKRNPLLVGGDNYLPDFLALISQFGSNTLSTRLFQIPPRATGVNANNDAYKSAMAALVSEAGALAKHLSEAIAALPSITMAQAWSDISCHHKAAFPNWSLVAMGALCLPAQSACVERGFSLHRCTKSRLRTNLELDTLDSLLRLRSLIGRHEWKDYDLSDALEVYESQPRRQFSKHPLLLGRLSKAISGFAVPEFLSSGVPIEGVLLAMTERDLIADEDEFEQEVVEEKAGDFPDIPVHIVLPAAAGAVVDDYGHFLNTFV